MFDQHTSRDGTICRICQMTDEHLINTVYFYTNLIAGLRRDLVYMLEMTIEEVSDLCKVYPSYDHYDVIEEKQEQLVVLLESLAPYSLEALLRDSTREPTAEMIQSSLERTKAVKDLSTLTYMEGYDFADLNYVEDDEPFQYKG
jgi:hypothetical protein